MLYEKLEESLNCLDVLFQARDEDIATITTEDKKDLRKTNEELENKELEFKNTVNSVSNLSNQMKDTIINLFYNYIEIFNDRNSYFDQKYYETGFKDAVGLILRSIKK